MLDSIRRGGREGVGSDGGEEKRLLPPSRASPGRYGIENLAIITRGSAGGRHRRIDVVARCLSSGGREREGVGEGGGGAAVE